MRRVEARELELALGLVALGLVLASAPATRAQRRYSSAVTISSFSRSIRSSSPRERRRVAAHVVVADRELVGWSISSASRSACVTGWKNGSKPPSSDSSCRSRAQKAWKVEQSQLLVGLAQQLLGARPHLLRRLGREGERQHAPGGSPAPPAMRSAA